MDDIELNDTASCCENGSFGYCPRQWRCPGAACLSPDELARRKDRQAKMEKERPVHRDYRNVLGTEQLPWVDRYGFTGRTLPVELTRVAFTAEEMDTICYAAAVYDRSPDPDPPLKEKN